MAYGETAGIQGPLEEIQGPLEVQGMAYGGVQFWVSCYPFGFLFTHLGF